MQASLDHKHRLQQLFFPERIAFDGIGSIEPPKRRDFSSTWCRRHPGRGPSAGSEAV